jgi:hypothetical protein
MLWGRSMDEARLGTMDKRDDWAPNKPIIYGPAFA